MFNRPSIFRVIGGSLLLLLNGICFANTALAVCYKTPADAIAANLTSSLYSISKNDGYRLVKIQSDPVLSQRWAMIISCDHPEWPAISFPLSISILPAQELRTQKSVMKIPLPFVVRAGDIVRIWKQESSLRIEVAGISEGNGGVGDLVKVRLLHRNTDDQPIVEQFSGIVRGPVDVEMKQ